MVSLSTAQILLSESNYNYYTIWKTQNGRSTGSEMKVKIILRFIVRVTKHYIVDFELGVWICELSWK